MGKINADLTVTGSFGKLSVYKRHDIDRMIVRTKGGPSKHKIKTSPSFATTRRNISEFGGRSAAVSGIRLSLIWQQSLADYNIAGPLNAFIRPVQELDTESEWGKRHVLLSKNPNLLAGFDLNRKYPFDTIIRNPLQHTLVRDSQQASVTIPALLPGINFHAPATHPVFGFVGSLGVIPDVYYGKHAYKSNQSYDGPERTKYAPVVTYSEWYPVLKGSPAVTLDIQMNKIFPDNGYSLVLSVGIRFGTIGASGNIEQVKRAGAAKIIAAV